MSDIINHIIIVSPKKNIHAVDTTPPTVVCPMNVKIEIELGVNSTMVNFTEPTATDLSGQVNVVSQTHSSGDVFPVGNTSVTFVFSDNAGNIASPCTFIIVVCLGKPDIFCF